MPLINRKRKADEDVDAAVLLAENKELKAKVADLEDEVAKLKKQVEEGDAIKAEESELSDDEDSVADDPNDKWTIMYRQLREHFIVNGNCKVTKTENPKLAKWIDNQKMYYGNGKLNKTGQKISEDRTIKLDSLGFNWGKKFKAPVSWDERFEEVKKYKKAMRCEPPVSMNNPTPLGIWVSAQRTEYRNFKKGRPSLLTMDQIGQLSDIGFKWKGDRLK